MVASGESNQPLLQKKYAYDLKGCMIYAIIFSILAFVGCLGFGIYCVVLRKPCQYIWLFLHPLIWILSCLYVRWVIQFKDKPGYSFFVGYGSCLIVFILNIIFIVWYSISMIKHHLWLYSIIIICSIVQIIYWFSLVVKLFQIASFVVTVFDETYSLLSLFRLSWIPEKTKRVSKIVSMIIIDALTFCQCGICYYSHCEKWTLWFSLGIAGVLFLTLLFFLPLYAWQVRTIWMRRVIVIIDPIIMVAFGVFACFNFDQLVCSTNHSLSLAIKCESILLLVCGCFRLFMAIATQKEYHLFSKDFDEFYAETEKHVEQVLHPNTV